jgi:hypothetical protein
MLHWGEPGSTAHAIDARRRWADMARGDPGSSTGSCFDGPAAHTRRRQQMPTAFSGEPKRQLRLRMLTGGELPPCTARELTDQPTQQRDYAPVPAVSIISEAVQRAAALMTHAGLDEGIRPKASYLKRNRPRQSVALRSTRRTLVPRSCKG